MSDTLENLIWDAISYGVIENRDEVPGYNEETGEFDDEVAAAIWLDEQIDQRVPAITLGGDLLAKLLDDQKFRLIVSRQAVNELFDKHMGIIDSRIKNRITNSYTPELNLELSKRISEIVKTEVDNQLRLRYTLIQQTVSEAIDKNFEQRVETEVKRRMDKLMEKIRKGLE